MLQSKKQKLNNHALTNKIYQKKKGLAYAHSKERPEVRRYFFGLNKTLLSN
uniref:Bm14114 n=1 Tax=Brugia malayi TaxID=6279 RepID=A0A1I9G9Q2_BRUMA|nr:Bm14114 [Brugia malayi]